MVSLQHDVANQCGPERAQRTPERDPRRAGGGNCTSCGGQQDLGRNLQKAKEPPKVACREGPRPGNALPGQARARAGPSGQARSSPSSPRQQAMLSETMAQSLRSTGLNNRVAGN